MNGNTKHMYRIRPFSCLEVCFICGLIGTFLCISCHGRWNVVAFQQQAQWKLMSRSGATQLSPNQNHVVALHLSNTAAVDWTTQRSDNQGTMPSLCEVEAVSHALTETGTQMEVFDSDIMAVLLDIRDNLNRNWDRLQEQYEQVDAPVQAAMLSPAQRDNMPKTPLPVKKPSSATTLSLLVEQTFPPISEEIHENIAPEGTLTTGAAVRRASNETPLPPPRKTPPPLPQQPEHTSCAKKYSVEEAQAWNRVDASMMAGDAKMLSVLREIRDSWNSLVDAGVKFPKQSEASANAPIDAAVVPPMTTVTVSPIPPQPTKLAPSPAPENMSVTNQFSKEAARILEQPFASVLTSEVQQKVLASLSHSDNTLSSPKLSNRLSQDAKFASAWTTFDRKVSDRYQNVLSTWEEIRESWAVLEREAAVVKAAPVKPTKYPDDSNAQATFKTAAFGGQSYQYSLGSPSALPPLPREPKTSPLQPPLPQTAPPKMGASAQVTESFLVSRTTDAIITNPRPRLEDILYDPAHFLKKEGAIAEADDEEDESDDDGDDGDNNKAYTGLINLLISSAIGVVLPLQLYYSSLPEEARPPMLESQVEALTNVMNAKVKYVEGLWGSLSDEAKQAPEAKALWESLSKAVGTVKLPENYLPDQVRPPSWLAQKERLAESLNSATFEADEFLKALSAIVKESQLQESLNSATIETRDFLNSLPARAKDAPDPKALWGSFSRSIGDVQVPAPIKGYLARMTDQLQTVANGKAKEVYLQVDKAVSGTPVAAPLPTESPSGSAIKPVEQSKPDLPTSKLDDTSLPNSSLDQGSASPTWPSAEVGGEVRYPSTELSELFSPPVTDETRPAPLQENGAVPQSSQASTETNTPPSLSYEDSLREFLMQQSSMTPGKSASPSFPKAAVDNNSDVSRFADSAVTQTSMGSTPTGAELSMRADLTGSRELSGDSSGISTTRDDKAAIEDLTPGVSFPAFAYDASLF
jgi:hypothetical protein